VRSKSKPHHAKSFCQTSPNWPAPRL